MSEPDKAFCLMVPSIKSCLYCNDKRSPVQDSLARGIKPDHQGMLRECSGIEGIGFRV